MEDGSWARYFKLERELRRNLILLGVIGTIVAFIVGCEFGKELIREERPLNTDPVLG